MQLSPTETAGRFGVSIKALRLYELRGLLTPLRSEAGWRTYGPDQITRLHQILVLKRLGLSLARIAQVLNAAESLDAVLAIQEQALDQDRGKLQRALTLLRAARAKLRDGQTLSIDDLATLNTETSMTSKLTRPTFFHPAMVPHQHKYFRPEEIEALASREDFDQERDIAIFFGLVAELRKIAATGDPGSAAARALGKRWRSHSDAVTGGDPDVAMRMRALTRDALADPATASQMPFSAGDLAFLEKIMGKLKDPQA
ncbi:MAG TPA: MerR family transcriptional regulator [Rhizomicrobium sp.]|nr:MerR family transcriptional regulator [Rhizomicrobium sp.]